MNAACEASKLMMQSSAGPPTRNILYMNFCDWFHLDSKYTDALKIYCKQAEAIIIPVSTVSKNDHSNGPSQALSSPLQVSAFSHANGLSQMLPLTLQQVVSVVADGSRDGFKGRLFYIYESSDFQQCDIELADSSIIMTTRIYCESCSNFVAHLAWIWWKADRKAKIVCISGGDCATQAGADDVSRRLDECAMHPSIAI
jgi:hypothetical protein